MTDSRKKPAKLAERLGNLRASIRALKAEEERVRNSILETNFNAPLEGENWVVTVRQSAAKRFEKDRLPPEILQDPRYWTSRPTVTVTAKARLQASHPRPARASAEEDFEVIEKW